MAKIQLNGKKITVKQNISIYDLLKRYQLADKKIAVEHNKTIISRAHFKKKKIKNNDKIEIVHFIGGG
tara:strand:+ start:17 stop:220 length:204 start_codon:yes stop_codon:yes gene_type:complete